MAFFLLLVDLLFFQIPSRLFPKKEGVKESSPWIQPKGRVDWRNFRALPLEIKALCRTRLNTHLYCHGG